MQKINRLRDELDQGYIPDVQDNFADDGIVNGDSLTPPIRIEAFQLLGEEDVHLLIANS